MAAADKDCYGSTVVNSAIRKVIEHRGRNHDRAVAVLESFLDRPEFSQKLLAAIKVGKYSHQ